MDVLGILSAFGLSASAGLNAYIPLLVVALLARFTHLIQLSSPWDVLSSGWIIALLVILSLIEFFADKVPAVNHVNDILQTFVRPTAGAILFAASANVLTEVNPILSLAAGLLIAGSIHAIKTAAVRPAVTAVSGGTANIPVSIAEDLVSTAVSIISVVVPAIIACLLILVTTWIVWLFWRRSRKLSQT